MLGQPGLDPATIHGRLQRLHRGIALATHGGELRAQQLQSMGTDPGIGHPIDERRELLETAIRALGVAGGAQGCRRHE
jgi:hypothetical protein